MVWGDTVLETEEVPLPTWSDDSNTRSLLRQALAQVLEEKDEGYAIGTLIVHTFWL